MNREMRRAFLLIVAICISLSVILASEKFEEKRRKKSTHLIQIGNYQYPSIPKKGFERSEEDNQELQLYHQLRIGYQKQKENIINSQQGFFGKLVYQESAGDNCIIWHLKMYHLSFELLLHLPVENVIMSTFEGIQPIDVFDIHNGSWVLVTYTHHDLLHLRHGANNCSYSAKVDKIIAFENDTLVDVQQIIPVDPFHSTYFMSLNQRLKPLNRAVNIITLSEDGSGRGSILSLHNDFQYGEQQGWIQEPLLSSHQLYLGAVKEIVNDGNSMILRLYQHQLTQETSAEFVIITTKQATEQGEMPTFFSAIVLEKFVNKEINNHILLGTFDWAISDSAGKLVLPHDVVIVEAKNKDSSSNTSFIASNVFVRRIDESFIQQNDETNFTIDDDNK